MEHHGSRHYHPHRRTIVQVSANNEADGPMIDDDRRPPQHRSGVPPTPLPLHSPTSPPSSFSVSSPWSSSSSLLVRASPHLLLSSSSSSPAVMLPVAAQTITAAVAMQPADEIATTHSTSPLPQRPRAPPTPSASTFGAAAAATTGTYYRNDDQRSDIRAAFHNNSTAATVDTGPVPEGVLSLHHQCSALMAAEGVIRSACRGGCAPPADRLVIHIEHLLTLTDACLATMHNGGTAAEALVVAAEAAGRAEVLSRPVSGVYSGSAAGGAWFAGLSLTSASPAPLSLSGVPSTSSVVTTHASTASLLGQWVEVLRIGALLRVGHVQALRGAWRPAALALVEALAVRDAAPSTRQARLQTQPSSRSALQQLLGRDDGLASPAAVDWREHSARSWSPRRHHHPSTPSSSSSMAPSTGMPFPFNASQGSAGPHAPAGLPPMALHLLNILAAVDSATIVDTPHKRTTAATSPNSPLLTAAADRVGPNLCRLALAAHRELGALHPNYPPPVPPSPSHAVSSRTKQTTTTTNTATEAHQQHHYLYPSVAVADDVVVASLCALAVILQRRVLALEIDIHDKTFVSASKTRASHGCSGRSSSSSSSPTHRFHSAGGEQWLASVVQRRFMAAHVTLAIAAALEAVVLKTDDDDRRQRGVRERVTDASPWSSSRWWCCCSQYGLPSSLFLPNHILLGGGGTINSANHHTSGANNTGATPRQQVQALAAAWSDRLLTLPTAALAPTIEASIANPAARWRLQVLHARAYVLTVSGGRLPEPFSISAGGVTPNNKSVIAASISRQGSGLERLHVEQPWCLGLALLLTIQCERLQKEEQGHTHLDVGAADEEHHTLEMNAEERSNHGNRDDGEEEACCTRCGLAVGGGGRSVLRPPNYVCDSRRGGRGVRCCGGVDSRKNLCQSQRPTQRMVLSAPDGQAFYNTKWSRDTLRLFAATAVRNDNNSSNSMLLHQKY